MAPPQNALGTLESLVRRVIVFHNFDIRNPIIIIINLIIHAKKWWICEERMSKLKNHNGEVYSSQKLIPTNYYLFVSTSLWADSEGQKLYLDLFQTLLCRLHYLPKWTCKHVFGTIEDLQYNMLYLLFLFFAKLFWICQKIRMH